MTGLDTNVIVRILVDDDAAQSARARRLVNRAIEADATLFVSNIVLCEVVWVLESSYEVARSEIIDVLRRLLHARHFAFEDSDRAARALEAFARGRGDFADYMIREASAAADCDAVATFDRALLKEKGFVAP